MCTYGISTNMYIYIYTIQINIQIVSNSIRASRGQKFQRGTLSDNTLKKQVPVDCPPMSIPSSFSWQLCNEKIFVRELAQPRALNKILCELVQDHLRRSLGQIQNLHRALARAMQGVLAALYELLTSLLGLCWHLFLLTMSDDVSDEKRRRERERERWHWQGMSLRDVIRQLTPRLCAELRELTLKRWTESKKAQLISWRVTNLKPLGSPQLAQVLLVNTFKYAFV